MIELRFLSHLELVFLVEAKTIDKNVRACAKFLLEAIDDYPKMNICEPDDFVKTLILELEQELSPKNLKAFLRLLSPATDCWKIESYSALIKLFELPQQAGFKPNNLEEILVHLSNYYIENMKFLR